MAEWPDAFIDWSVSITVEDVEWHTRGRFQNYPFLWDNPTKGCRRIATTLAQAGRERAFQIASDLRQFPAYFHNLPEYKRWLLTVGYREALRATFYHPDITVLLDKVTREQATMLRYLYIDQMTDDQLATALGTFPAAKARDQGVAAYRALCDLLRGQGWGREDMAPFPAYPTFPGAL